VQTKTVVLSFWHGVDPSAKRATQWYITIWELPERNRFRTILSDGKPSEALSKAVNQTSPLQSGCWTTRPLKILLENGSIWGEWISAIGSAYVPVLWPVAEYETKVRAERVRAGQALTAKSLAKSSNGGRVGNDLVLCATRVLLSKLINAWQDGQWQGWRLVLPILTRWEWKPLKMAVWESCNCTMHNLSTPEQGGFRCPALFVRLPKGGGHWWPIPYARIDAWHRTTHTGRSEATIEEAERVCGDWSWGRGRILALL
jgi:hypothetical protein